MTDRVLIIGSGPNAIDCKGKDLSGFGAVVVINNAWRVRPDWTHLIHPEDFPSDRRPLSVSSGQQVITAKDYVPCQNRWGGFVYAGGTMAFTAGYWALDALQPGEMHFLGCDMVYPREGDTHFYGKGSADPLRDDPTLQDLEAKSARLMLMAASRGTACFNLSQADESRLVFPRSEWVTDNRKTPADPADMEEYKAACLQEKELSYFVPSGRYWEAQDSFDKRELKKLDALWISALSAYNCP